ncbi:reprolysin-like metallopeptidase [Chitinimonas lacunae]|uniref:Reprolysin-like metallopeptidase n=1 Tax=Chitinimonas lacunae TaxID=1963018 RepID=A0ABV8MYD8_9NEIS
MSTPRFASLLLGLGLALPAHAAQLFTLSQQGFASRGEALLRLDGQAAFSAKSGDRLDFQLPDGSRHRAALDRIVHHPNGDRSWVGHLVDQPTYYRVLLTQGSHGLSGRILTPRGEYLIEPSPGNQFAADSANLIDVRSRGLTLQHGGDDGLIHPRSDSPVPETPPASSFSTAQAQIDVLVLYPAELASRYGNPETVINGLTLAANQAYIDSQVGITLRVVKTLQVSYTKQVASSTTLEEMTYGTDPAFSDLKSLRQQYGADLVTYVQPFNRTAMGNCGIAWVGGGGGHPISQSRDYGYSVVGYGRDTGGSNFFCSQYTYAHELGHNMGSSHDRANSSTQGAYPYSYGHGIAGQFGTVMSYISPVVGYFSNPHVTCPGSSPCGVDENASNSANNALSLNNTKAAVAAYMAEVAVPNDSDRVFNWAQATYSSVLYPANSNSLTGAGYYYRHYSGSNTYLGTQNNRVYFLDGNTGQLSDMGDLSHYLTQAINAGY